MLINDRTLKILGKLTIDIANGCLFGYSANKLGTYAGEKTTDNKEAKVWTGFFGSILSQTGLVYVMEKRRWCKTGVTITSSKIVALFASAFPKKKEETKIFFEPSTVQNQFYAEKPWHKLMALFAGGAAAFQATKHLNPIWGVVFGNMVAGIPTRVEKRQ
ncbi:MAG: hypothetical protein JSR58_08090 [Verrucomicrobia bacterium]|nr:hypothetical protein [Verrucomicrobiota bacterium]